MSCVAVGIGAGISAIGGIAGSVISGNSAKSAADAQAAAANHATDVQQQEWQQQQDNQKPFLQAGQAAIGQMGSMAANPQTFSASDLASNMDPSYQFELQQGQQAIQRSAAAQGGLQSGGTLKSMAQYTQNMASTGYQQAYNNFNTNQTNQFNRLASVAGAGQTSNGQLGQAGQNYANQVGNNMMGAANAQGAASIAQGNQLGNTLSSLGSGIGNGVSQMGLMNQNQNWLSGMQPGGGLQMPSIGASSGFGAAPAAPTLGNFSYS